ncbi:MAG: DNA polymerase IV, partial [Lachnospiraceae bacterium]|nr:DNA polymerase IV [Lachnospiraceae bacterium]
MAQTIIYHVDVNSAFLSWTACDILEKNPNAVDIREIPSAICGDPSKRHGIILAKSTPAKKYGVVTAEPIQQALRKCPNL